MHVPWHVVLETVPDQELCAGDVESAIHIDNLHLVGLALEDASSTLLVVVPLVVEVRVPVSVLLLFEVHAINPEKLKVKNFYGVLVVAVDVSLQVGVVVALVELRHVIPILTSSVLSDLLEVLLLHLIRSESLQILNGHTLDVTGVDDVVE